MPNLPFIIAEPSGPGPMRQAPDYASAFRQMGEGVAGIIGGIAETHQTVKRAEEEFVARRDLAMAAGELEEFEFSLNTDPDYDTHEERYQEKVREIVSRQKEMRTDLARAFALGLEEMAQNGIARVRNSVLQRRHDTILSAGAAERDEYIERAALARSPEERESYRERVADSLNRSALIGAMTRQDALAESRALDKKLFSAELRNTILSDPMEALIQLSDPAGKFADMPENERATWRQRATGEYRRRLSAEYSANRSAYLNEKRARLAAREQAAQDLWTMMGPNGKGFITSDDVFERAELLGKDTTMFQDIASRGGRPGNPVDNPNVYIAMSRAAETGEDVSSAADYYLSHGLLTKPTRDALVSTSREVRFRPVREYLSQIAKPQTHPSLPTSRDAAEASARAKLEFDMWLSDHPGATQEEAFATAKEIGKRYASRLSVAAGLVSKTPDQRRAELFSKYAPQVGILPGRVPTPEQLRELKDNPAYQAELEKIDAAEAIAPLGMP